MCSAVCGLVWCGEERECEYMKEREREDMSVFGFGDLDHIAKRYVEISIFLATMRAQSKK